MKRMLIALTLILLGAAPISRGEVPPSRPFPGVRYWTETRTDPAMVLYVVKVDLTDPDVSLRVSRAGDDPDGDGPWQTVLMPPSKIAGREKFDVCVNASFFSARNTKDAEGAKSGFVAGVWSSVTGIGVTDGTAWSQAPSKNWPAFWIDDKKTAHLAKISDLPAGAIQAVQGNAFVLKDGEPIEPAGMMKVRHPRTVIGIDKTGSTLTLLTIDGRKPGVSIGMTGPELGAEAKRIGCHTAINLDGGGSTELVLRDPETGKLRVMNHPSDGRERAVADVIGIQIRGVKRAEE